MADKALQIRGIYTEAVIVKMLLAILSPWCQLSPQLQLGHRNSHVLYLKIFPRVRETGNDDYMDFNEYGIIHLRWLRW